MRKRLSVLLICSVVLVSMLLIPTLAWEMPEKPIRCILGISLNWDWVETGVGPSWFGIVYGDIEGEVSIYLLGAYFDYPTPPPEDVLPIWEVFWEEWIIETDEGTITILNAGVWSFETFKFLSNGPVVAATGEWEYLIGSTMYCNGVTTEWPVDPPTPVFGVGEMRIE